MSGTYVHPTPSETTFVEDAKEVRVFFRRFYERNHTAIISTVVLGVSTILTRVMLRRELKRIHFAVEIFPDDQFDPYDDQLFNDNTD